MVVNAQIASTGWTFPVDQSLALTLAEHSGKRGKDVEAQCLVILALGIEDLAEGKIGEWSPVACG